MLKEIFEGEFVVKKINNNTGALPAGEARCIRRREMWTGSPLDFFFRSTIASNPCQAGRA
jgi:hypothetical protein